MSSATFGLMASMDGGQNPLARNFSVTRTSERDSPIEIGKFIGVAGIST